MLSDSKFYEIAFLAKDSEGEKAIADLINQHKGNIFQKSPLKEVKLAYPINKQTSAYFGYIQFEILPDNIGKVSQSLKLNPSILRHLTVAMPVMKKIPERERRMAKEIIKPSLIPSSRSVLTNKALEEKIEEILK